LELDKIVDPILLFKQWLSEAEKKEIRDPNAMQLATVSKNGMPSVRTVLLKDIINCDFVFYTNYESRKSNEIIRLVGDITKVSEDISDKYYKSRSRGSRIGAWASKQSRELESREALMEEVRLFESKYTDDIPRPSHWGGFALKPIEFEFWQDSDFRLHDRFILKPTKQNNQWIAKRHYP